MDAATLNAYETRAAEFAARYGAADLTPLHRLLLAHLPSGCRVLEVGCGTGREAAFLAGHGFRVVATDASAAMLAQAERHPDVTCIAYSDPRVCYGPFMHLLQAAFPLPSDHPLLADRFDAVLALAVVMHLPDADLFEFAFQIRSLLNPGGTVALSLSEGRALGADSRAPDGRLFRERPPGEVTLLFERLGFRILAREESADTLGRDAIRWTTLVLRLDAASGSRPVDQIETIINHDKKDATYKLALLRALCDIAQTACRHVRWHPDGTVSVPLGLVTEKWLLWNLLPADAKVNNAKRDRLVSRATLDRSRDAIITAWQTTRAAMPDRFDLELSRTLFGRNHAETQWEAPAFSALVEAVETLAIQRGVERWEPAKPLAATVQAPAANARRNSTESESHDVVGSRYSLTTDAPGLELDGRRPITHYHALSQERTLLDPGEVPRLAFKSALPIVADLAAGPFFDGFETGHLHDLNDLDWIAVPPALCKPNRFVIRVAGDSMEPLFNLGDLLVFEYHRTPRQDNQIVIAADFTDGTASGAYAVKRYRAHPDTWIFASENPSYEPVRIPKAEMAYPILGVYVEKL